VFITHGGMNSVNEALYSKVPLCVHPFQSEQEEVAQQIVKMSCGVKIKKLTRKDISSAVKEVLEHKKYKLNCIKISASFRETGGYTDATNAIFSHIESVKNER
jgi:UDP:flavonoid glycosyltransferase YjiC (YdhE family)